MYGVKISRGTEIVQQQESTFVVKKFGEASFAAKTNIKGVRCATLKQKRRFPSKFTKLKFIVSFRPINVNCKLLRLSAKFTHFVTRLMYYSTSPLKRTFSIANPQ